MKYSKRPEDSNNYYEKIFLLKVGFVFDVFVYLRSQTALGAEFLKKRLCTTYSQIINHLPGAKGILSAHFAHAL
jgi:hypothetical protein